MFNVLLLQAASPAPGPQPSGFGMLMPLVLIVGIMYLFMIRPQQKKQKEIRNFQNSLAEGTHVVTGGGIHGTVKKIDLEKNAVEIEIARGVVVTCDRSYVFADASGVQMNK